MFKSNITKTTAVLVVAVFVTTLIMSPALSTVDIAFAKQKYKNWSDCREDHSKNWCKKYFKKHHHNDNKNGGGGNKASQGIGQSQSSSQNSQVVSGGDTENSGNNFSFQNQENKGNNAAAQQ